MCEAEAKRLGMVCIGEWGNGFGKFYSIWCYLYQSELVRAAYDSIDGEDLTLGALDGVKLAGGVLVEFGK